MTDGERTRRAVLGDAHVDRAQAATTDIDAPFQDLVTEAAWGRVWGDPTLPHRERSMLTLALLAAQGAWDEFEMHVRATARTGASADDIQQVLMHVAIYAGVPRANEGLRRAKAILAETGR
ncbi:MAG: 4-carboxymuconolactone decarboxylase [Shimia sp.]